MIESAQGQAKAMELTLALLKKENDSQAIKKHKEKEGGNDSTNSRLCALEQQVKEQIEDIKFDQLDENTSIQRLSQVL